MIIKNIMSGGVLTFNELHTSVTVKEMARYLVATIIVGVIIASGFILFLIPGIILISMLASSIFSIVEYKTESIRGSIVESFKINKNSFGFVFLNYIIFLILIGILIGALMSLFPLKFAALGATITLMFTIPLIISIEYVIFKKAKENYPTEIVEITDKNKRNVVWVFFCSSFVALIAVFIIGIAFFSAIGGALSAYDSYGDNNKESQTISPENQAPVTDGRDAPQDSN